MKKVNLRGIFCVVLVLLVSLVYIGRLGQWQLVNGETYAQEAEIATGFVKLNGARGQILDRNGVVLAGNRSVYNVIFSRISWVPEKRNETILAAIRLLEQLHVSWIDRLPIETTAAGQYRFRSDRTAEQAELKSEGWLNLPEQATAEECMASLQERYGIAEDLSPESARIIASVRYSMERNYFSRSNPCVLARDVSMEVVSVVSEQIAQMPGIEIQVSQVRDYADGDTAPHVVGTMGAISEYQYARAKEADNLYSATNVSGYTYNDTVGQSGIESVFETQLRGKNGKQVIEVDANGNVVRVTVTDPPAGGDSVRLTLDSRLQKAANEALEQQISAGLTEDCTAGAVVALDVNTGGILCCVSYPTFDLNQYSTDDTYLLSLYNDENQPLFNRALNGIFTPGSVFKPLVGVAALEEGVVNEASRPVVCDGAYHYYQPDYEPVCMGVHDDLTIRDALSHSCNSYFFDVGRMLTIRRLGAYAELFALGEKTGCELPESVGIMSDPYEYVQRHDNAQWYDGLTIQASIGQCDDMFTPIELATYCSMLANGGTRYKTHFLEAITDYDGVMVRETYQPEVVLQAEISEQSFRVVQEGMRKVCTEGTAASTFRDFGIAVAGKTGTAENASHSDNLTFIGYAPYDNPQIAVAVVIEYGGKGNGAKEVARAVFEAYFQEELQRQAEEAARRAAEEAERAAESAEADKPAAEV